MTTYIHISCSELCEHESVDEHFVLEAVEYGVISPLEGTQISNWVFSVDDVVWFKKALRLQQDLELDWDSLALVVELLQSKDSLEQENQQLRQRLERFILLD
jgi:chaperone modulatory protein CbpM